MKTVNHRTGQQCVKQLRFASHTLVRSLVTNARPAKNYYEVLGVNDKSDSKAIRMAYLALCKQFHPDVNREQTVVGAQRTDTRTKFQEINDAYNCLIREDLRRAYDSQLKWGRSGVNANHYDGHRYRSHYNDFRYEQYWRDDQWSGEDMYRRRQSARRRPPDFGSNYYGIRGVPRVANDVIVTICTIFILVGMFGHFCLYKLTVMRQRVSREQSQQNALLYEQIRRQMQDRRVKADTDAMHNVSDQRLNEEKTVSFHD